MDEQTTPTEPVYTAPDPVVADIPTVEPPQTESPQPQAEPVSAPETPQIEPLSEPLPTTAETSTPHLPADEALPESTPEPTPQGAVAPAQGPQGPLPFSKTDDRQENLVAPTETPQNILKLLLTKANLTIKLRKQKKLLKVMTLFAKKSHITNDDVEKLLHVSDATALRYLSQLKKENKITQIGKTRQGVTYTRR